MDCVKVFGALVLLSACGRQWEVFSPNRWQDDEPVAGVPWDRPGRALVAALQLTLEGRRALLSGWSGGPVR